MITFVVASRNDGHGGDLIGRMNTFVDSLACQAARHKLPVELIVVEWNSPNWARPLSEMLEATPGDFFQAKVITVPGKYHDRLKYSEVLEFYQMIAKNVGIRRASYPWIACTNCDVIFDDKAFDQISVVLHNPLEKKLYRIIRHDLNVTTVPRGTMDEQLTFCANHAGQRHDATCFAPVNLHTHACGDFTMLHTNAWNEMLGYPEFQLWSIHIDSAFLLQAVVSFGYKEQVLEGSVYHLAHGRSWVAAPGLAKTYPSISMDNLVQIYKISSLPGVKLLFNKMSWGFQGEPLPEVSLC